MTGNSALPHSHALLDGPRIAQTRLALGVSLRELSEVTGIATQTLKAIETQEGSRRTGTWITLNQLALVADILALHPRDLFIPEPGGTHEALTDAQQVAALLQHNGRPIPPELLAEALDWNLDRLTEATDNLSLALPLVGLRLNINRAGHLSIVSSANVAGPAAKRLSHLAIGNRGMTRVEAETTMAAASGRLPSNDIRDAVHRVAVGRLLKVGVLTIKGPALAPTPALEFALDF